MKEIQELKRRLLAYENAHTPPSRNKRKYPTQTPTGNPVGAPKGHTGTTRQYKEPDEIIDVKQETCSSCSHKLGKPVKILKRIIEDIPEPQPIKVTQYNIHTYLCKHCAEVNIAKHSNLPSDGRFGYNLMIHIALMKYRDRLPLRKITQTLNRQYDIHLTPATVLDITERVANSCEPIYEQIRQQIKNSLNVYGDETGQKVQGKNWWTFVFATLNSALFLIRKSRGQKVIKEALGNDYKGILNCDGWTSYPMIINKIQRCWAHLLREAKWLAEEYNGQARLLYAELCEMFDKIKFLRKQELIHTGREEQYAGLVNQMKNIVNRTKAYTELKKFAEKIEHGINYWFTCVLHPAVEPTNNIAERALREFVVQRKITGTLRNERGTHIMEVLMSVLRTWELQGLNTYSMLRTTLSS